MSRLAPMWLALLLGPAALAAPAPPGTLAGTVETRSGERLEGPIRWGEDDRFWTDRLDAFRVEASHPFRISIFGVRLLGPPLASPRSLSVPWGLVDAVLPGDGAALVRLAGGRELAAEHGEVDGAVRLRVGDGPSARDVRLDRVREVRFADGPRSVASRGRIAGRVVAVDGDYEGFLAWDRDERTLEETVDGFDADGERRSIPFARIREVGRVDGESSDFRLDDGTTLRLSGTNDVGPGHRGIVVEGDGCTVAIPWREVERVRLGTPPGTAAWGFGDDEPILAVVCTKDGRTLAGELEWDLDERFRFETLEGRTAEGAEYAIRFDRLVEVAPLDGRSSVVRLRDGRTFELRDRNDVASDHRGLRVGTADPLLWYEVRRVRFAADVAELGRLREEAACGDP